MHRRQFTLTLAALALTPVLARAARIPPIEFEGEDFAQVRYAGGEEDGIRTVSARVSRWADAAAAEEFRQRVIAGAGSNLPMGEFYQSEPEEQPIPDGTLDDPATLVTWYTTVGAAGFVTEWALLAVRRDTLLWELRVSGAEADAVTEVAVSLAISLVAREPGDDLFALLPAADEVPAGLTLDYTMSPEGTFNPEGTPIPEPTAVPN